MHYVKLIVVVLLARCLGGVRGGVVSHRQEEAAAEDTLVRLIKVRPPQSSLSRRLGKAGKPGSSEG